MTPPPAFSFYFYELTAGIRLYLLLGRVICEKALVHGSALHQRYSDTKVKCQSFEIILAELSCLTEKINTGKSCPEAQKE